MVTLIAFFNFNTNFKNWWKNMCLEIGSESSKTTSKLDVQSLLYRGLELHGLEHVEV